MAGLLVILAPVVAIGYLVHWQAQETLLAEYGMRLDSLAVEHRQVLNLLIHQQQEALRAVAQTGQLKRLADTLSGRKSDAGSSGEGHDSSIPLPVAQLLFRGLLLVGPTGTRTLATGAFEGLPLNQWTEDLARAGQGVWIRGDAGTEGGPYLLVGMPAKDGVALAWASLTGIEAMLLDRRALGTNGESFIVDRHGRPMAPELRYPHRAGEKVLSNAMERCLQGESRPLVVEADYTGALTAMAYQSLPEIGGGCLMVHVRADEIFASARALRNRIVALTLSALFVLFPAGLSLGRRVGRHTEALLRQAHGELEQLVQQRTSELTQTNTALQAEIAERRRTEEALNRTADELRDLYDNAPCGYHSLDKNSTFVASNATELAWLGYQRDEVIGKMKYTDLLLPDSMTRFEEHFPRFKEQGWVRDMELEMVRKDGTVLPVLMNATAIKDKEGNYLASRSTVFDITKRKLQEHKLSTLNYELQRKATELRAANEELEAFAYSVSHDLRAPLRSIDGFSQALLEDYTDKLDEEGRDYLGRVRAATQRMAGLIDNLLTLSRVTRTELYAEPIDLSALAHEIADELHQVQPARDVAFAITEGLVVKGDHTLLRVVLENLLDNAWKFTSSHSSARIEFGMTDHDGQPAYFVRDDGVGFDMAYAGKLFTPFQRLHTEVEFPGTGIGLATIQRIVHRHGGRAWAEGAVGQGATVYFTLG